MNKTTALVMNHMLQLYAGDPKRIQHFTKVFTYSCLIGINEGLDPRTQMILEIAALTHDIGIHTCEAKYGTCNGKQQEAEGPAIARTLLTSLDLPSIDSQLIDRICFLIGHHHTYTDVDSIDWQILLEADFLVNAYEDKLAPDSIRSGYERIFKTMSGKEMLKQMYSI